MEPLPFPRNGNSYPKRSEDWLGREAHATSCVIGANHSSLPIIEPRNMFLPGEWFSTANKQSFSPWEYSGSVSSNTSHEMEMGILGGRHRQSSPPPPRCLPSAIADSDLQRIGGRSGTLTIHRRYHDGSNSLRTRIYCCCCYNLASLLFMIICRMITRLTVYQAHRSAGTFWLGGTKQ